MMDVADALGVQIALNRERQRELYGTPLGDRVRTLIAGLGISQARLARTIGISPAMLSQLVSARRVKIGDPRVLARLSMIDQRFRSVRTAPDPGRVDALLAEIAEARWDWTDPRVSAQRGRSAGSGTTAVDALRGLADPARLAAAAAVLGPAFPELAAALRQAASRPRV